MQFMDKYMLRPARKILLMENKAKKVENNKFVGEFNSCVGEMQEDFYVVTFTVDGSDVFKKLYFSKDMYILLSDFKNKWIHNPILNRSGLAALVWSPEGENKTPNMGFSWCEEFYSDNTMIYKKFTYNNYRL